MCYLDPCARKRGYRVSSFLALEPEPGVGGAGSAALLAGSACGAAPGPDVGAQPSRTKHDTRATKTMIRVLYLMILPLMVGPPRAAIMQSGFRV